MTDQKKPGKTFTLLDAFRCAGIGIFEASHERNFRIEACFAIFTIILGIILGCSTTEWLIIVLCFGLVLGGEIFNCANEAIVDLLSPDYNELARIAKDCSAGAVLVFSIASFIIGCIIFVPKLLVLMGLL